MGDLISSWVDTQAHSLGPVRQAVAACKEPPLLQVGCALGAEHLWGGELAPPGSQLDLLPLRWWQPGLCLWLCHTARPPSGSTCLTSPVSLSWGWTRGLSPEVGACERSLHQPEEGRSDASRTCSGLCVETVR